MPQSLSSPVSDLLFLLAPCLSLYTAPCPCPVVVARCSAYCCIRMQSGHGWAPISTADMHVYIVRHAIVLGPVMSYRNRVVVWWYEVKEVLGVYCVLDVLQVRARVRVRVRVSCT